MRQFGLIVLISIYAVSCSLEAHNDMNKNLIWSEEFNYNGALDKTKWEYDLGDGCPTLCGWGNNEEQVYVKSNENVRVNDGKLIIEAHRNTKDSVIQFTSARIHTKGKSDWKYGYMEINAKIPYGRGTWPAIWMLPTDWKYGGWPKSGEIDIMEHVGFDPGIIHGTVHTEAYNHMNGTQKGKQIKLDKIDDFNLYAINWTENKIDFMVNGKIYNTFKNNDQGSAYWPYDQPYYLILNIAVGGNWGGKMGISESIWPQRMEVDYIRVYKEKPEDNSRNN